MSEPTKDDKIPNGAPAAAPPASTAAKQPEKPAAAPAKATQASQDKEKPIEPRKLRRRVIWSLIWGYLAVNFLMFLRFFFPRALFEPKTVFTIGYPSDFGLGVDQKFLKDYRVWVVRDPDRLFVIYARCTHLGCTPEWKAAENKFKCPCHGSGYDSDGINFEGPAPRPMDRASIALDPTGEIVVDTSKLFQCPKTGRCQFNDPGAYLVV